MKILLILSSMIFSNAFFFMNHPIAIVLIILTQSINICVLIYIYFFSSWFSLILFLMFMGG